MDDVKDYAESYRRAVATRKQRYGENAYSDAGRRSPTHGFKDRAAAQLAAYKKHHPQWFDANGQLKPEVQIILSNKAKGVSK